MLERPTSTSAMPSSQSSNARSIYFVRIPGLAHLGAARPVDCRYVDFLTASCTSYILRNSIGK